jgi:ribosomal protein L37AE/L43A
MDTNIRVNPNGTLDATCEGCRQYGPSGGRCDDASGQFFCSTCWGKFDEAANGAAGGGSAKKSLPKEEEVAPEQEGEPTGEFKKNRRPKTCVECGDRSTEVKQDEVEGLWYCWPCWKIFATPVAEKEADAGGKESVKEVNPSWGQESRPEYDPHAHGHSTKEEKMDMLQFLR